MDRCITEIFHGYETISRTRRVALIPLQQRATLQGNIYLKDIISVNSTVTHFDKYTKL